LAATSLVSPKMIPIFSPALTGREREYVLDCMDTGWISSQGEYVRRFERAFADFCGMSHGVATTSCTTALHLALAALDIGLGDEVICPDLTFIAPVNMVRLTGARPVLVDCETDTWNIDPAGIARALSPRTKAIVVVHAFGHSARMDEIMALANERGVPVIEDVAEAPGARYKGTMLGSIGAMSCYSFFGNKIITTGEGGIVLTDDSRLRDRLEVLRDHGMSKERRYHHTHIGFNYRMTNLQGAIGLAQVEVLPEVLERRSQQEEAYERALGDSPLHSFRPKHEWCETVHWMMTVTLTRAGLRDDLIDYLKSKAIDSRQMIFPVHLADPYRNMYEGTSFENAERISLNSIHLPSSLELTGEQIVMIADTVNAWLEARA